MTINLVIDPTLLERAVLVSGERTKKATVTKDPQKFTGRPEQRRVANQELLRGFSGAKAQTQIIERFDALPLL